MGPELESLGQVTIVLGGVILHCFHVGQGAPTLLRLVIKSFLRDYRRER